MKVQHDRKLRPKRLKEGDLVLWYPGKMNGKRKNLTVGWSGPYELFRLYENGSAKLKDLEGMELPDRVNIGKLKKYQTREENQEAKAGKENLREVIEKEKTPKGQPEKRVTRQSAKRAKENVAEVSHITANPRRNNENIRGTSAWKTHLAYATMIILTLILSGLLAQTSMAEHIKKGRGEYRNEKGHTCSNSLYKPAFTYYFYDNAKMLCTTNSRKGVRSRRLYEVMQAQTVQYAVKHLEAEEETVFERERKASANRQRHAGAKERASKKEKPKKHATLTKSRNQAKRRNEKKFMNKGGGKAGYWRKDGWWKRLSSNSELSKLVEAMQ